MFEPKNTPLLSTSAFAERMVFWLGISVSLMALSLLVGMVGYHYFEHMGWLDAFLNAAMILGGMGPVSVMSTAGGKLFAGFYALYSGVFLVVCGGLLLAPLFHRVLHRFHQDSD